MYGFIPIMPCICSINEDVDILKNATGTKYFVQCNTCKATGSMEDSEDDAIESWNQQQEDSER
jgi:hypothetical protein